MVIVFPFGAFEQDRGINGYLTLPEKTKECLMGWEFLLQVPILECLFHYCPGTVVKPTMGQPHSSGKGSFLYF